MVLSNLIDIEYRSFYNDNGYLYFPAKGGSIMKKRLLSLAMALCMVLSLLPATAFADENEETPVCTCEEACTAETINAECAVCGAEGASVENCCKYVAPAQEESIGATTPPEAPVCVCEDACTADAMDAECPVCGAEGAIVENCGKYIAPVVEEQMEEAIQLEAPAAEGSEQTAVEIVQVMIDALPTVALAGETPNYSIENGILVISGTTNGSDLPTEGFTRIKITTTGVVTGGTYTVDVENYGTITGGKFNFVMNRNGGTGSSLALITGGTFEEVSNFGNMTGGTVGTLNNIDTTNNGHTVQGVTVTGSLYNNNSNCSDMTLNIPLEKVTNILSITTVRQLVNGTERFCPVGQNAASWLKSNVANADWYQLNGKEWVKLTATDVFPCEKMVYSKIPGMSLGTMGSMQDISGNWIVPVADSDNPNVINKVFTGKIGVFNSSAVWYVGGQPVEGKFSPPAMSYTVTEGDIGKDAVAVLTDGYATIQSPTIRIVESLSVTVPTTVAVGETITPVFNWRLKTNYLEGMTSMWST